MNGRGMALIEFIRDHKSVMTNKCISCNNNVEFWLKKVAKEDEAFPNWWYPFCKLHLDKILRENKVVFSELIFHDQKIRKYKQRKHVNWKMFLDWEELEYHPKIKTYDKAFGDIKITMALTEHRKNKLKKYIKNLYK